MNLLDNSDVQVDEICVLVDLLRSSDWGGDESRSGGRHNVVRGSA